MGRSRAAGLKADQQKQVAATDSKQSEVLTRISKGEDPFAVMPSSTKVEQVSAEFPAPGPKSPAFADVDPISHKAEPREALSATALPPTGFAPTGFAPTGVVPQQHASATGIPIEACPPGVAPWALNPYPGPGSRADEYVRDGGDNGLPVHYEGKYRAGLEVEDTIAEYMDEEGKVRLKPSTQAAIYAPRFGEVRSATLPKEDMSVAKAVGHQDGRTVAGLNTKQVTSEQVQRDEPLGMQTRTRASGLRARVADDQLDKAIGAQNHVKLVNAFEDIRFLQEGRFERITTASLGLSVAAAQEWADGRRPIVVAQDVTGDLVQGVFSVQDFTGSEDRRTPGELKLVKVADKSSAHPGDIVTFTIRFDNVGERDLLKIRVIDNLSPRLEFVEGSISANMDGKIDVTDNGQGSKLLTFEFDQPLKGKTGGFVSFQCKVR
ncbi:DUF11 domain-containing protein [Planctomicrobium sp. SH527]|uniref:DUF11 domain-containing protein n=1 Tax=Planctomicrobium sp. SH527 TaxID=3448123 RepID=UPI003F5B3ABE